MLNKELKDEGLADRNGKPLNASVVGETNNSV